MVPIMQLFYDNFKCEFEVSLNKYELKQSYLLFLDFFRIKLLNIKKNNKSFLDFWLLITLKDN